MPTLPFSLSPHICVLPSSDLRELLDGASLPPLPQILQSFVPLSQVNTRTTTLTTVPHASFALRFSDLQEVEASVNEDEEQRAGRTMDWIGSRVASQSARWIEVVEAAAAREDNPFRNRTPWWDEVKRCVEGDQVPNRMEGWNHPVAIVCAVSTLAANPLQALQDMHARQADFPPWVDNTHLRYSLIVHPSNSALSDSIAESLFNAVKKQFGLHTYLMSLTLPDSPPQQPPRLPSPMPRLPPLSSMELSPMPSSQVPGPIEAMLNRPTTPKAYAPGSSTLSVNAFAGAPQPQQQLSAQAVAQNTLSLNDNDVQQFSRFVREFLVMSLIPWMEKYVIEWNESYSSSRRLPSRLFSSTRRLFGTGYSSSAPATPVAGHGSNASISSVSSRFTHAANNSVSSLASITSAGSGSTAVAAGGGVTQQRRLAEFATILGDYKLAISVWETLRKDGKGGSDILPLLVMPSPALALHASNAIAALHAIASEMPALAQLRALTYAVRWDIGIDPREFLGSALDGDRWLVHASGAAEEPPAALLLGHAAFLSAKKNGKRRAALWYLRAGDRLEKAGIKPLALHFFRQAHELYSLPSRRPKELSPSFWESEGRAADDWRGFEGVLPGIEHEIGRLLYTTGDTAGAVRHFLGLLRESPSVRLTRLTGLGFAAPEDVGLGQGPTPDRVYLEDFGVALKHFRTTDAALWESAKDSMQMLFKICQVKDSRLRLPGDSATGSPEAWKQLEEEWEQFWRPRGKERLVQGGKAAVNETFWFDLVMRNPLNVEVTVSNLSLTVRDAQSPDADAMPDFVEVDVVDDVTLGAKETRTIPIGIRCAQPASLFLTHAVFEFLSLLPVKESLARPGKRLHDTPQQRQNKVYAPDTLTQIEVEDVGLRLQASFVDNRYLTLFHGEHKPMTLSLRNSGNKPIDELWLLTGPQDKVWIDIGEAGTSSAVNTREEVVPSNNSLAPRKPFRIPLDVICSSVLDPGETVDLSIVVHAAHALEQDLSLLFTSRERDGPAFRSTRLTRHFEVRRILDITTTHESSQSFEHPYLVNLDISNVSTSNPVRVAQITTMSPLWSCAPITEYTSNTIVPRQLSRISFTAKTNSASTAIKKTWRFVQAQLRTVLQGGVVQSTAPPPIDVFCHHICKSSEAHSLNDAATRHLVHLGKQGVAARLTAATHPHVSENLHPSIFPLYNPSAVDVVIFWDIPAQGRSGHLLVTGLTLGVIHAPLSGLIDEAENAKVKRSMYAETRRERAGILAAVRDSEWNAEMDPLSITTQDGLVVEHDFGKGPAHVPAAFLLRNHSITNSIRYTFRLPASAEPRSTSPFLSPKYAGRLTYKGELAPSGSTLVTAKFCAWYAGTYALNAWAVGIEVLESPSPGDKPQVRQRYEQTPQAGDSTSVTVVDTSRS